MFWHVIFQTTIWENIKPAFLATTTTIIVSVQRGERQDELHYLTNQLLLTLLSSTTQYHKHLHNYVDATHDFAVI